MKEKKYVDEDILGPLQIDLTKKSENNPYLNSSILDITNSSCLEIERRNNEMLFESMDKKCAISLLYKAMFIPFDDFRKMLKTVSELDDANYSKNSLINYFEAVAVNASEKSVDQLPISWYQASEPFKHLFEGKLCNAPGGLSKMSMDDKSKSMVKNLNDAKLCDAMIAMHLAYRHWVISHLLEVDKNFEVLDALDQDMIKSFRDEAYELVEKYKEYLVSLEVCANLEKSELNSRLGTYKGFSKSLKNTHDVEENIPNTIVTNSQFEQINEGCCILM